jgi:hypothetical protein
MEASLKIFMNKAFMEPQLREKVGSNLTIGVWTTRSCGFGPGFKSSFS